MPACALPHLPFLASADVRTVPILSLYATGLLCSRPSYCLPSKAAVPGVPLILFPAMRLPPVPGFQVIHSIRHTARLSGFISLKKAKKPPQKQGGQKGAVHVRVLSLNSYPRGGQGFPSPPGHCTAGTNKTGGAGFIYPHRHKYSTRA